MMDVISFMTESIPVEQRYSDLLPYFGEDILIDRIHSSAESHNSFNVTSLFEYFLTNWALIAGNEMRYGDTSDSGCRNFEFWFLSRRKSVVVLSDHFLGRIANDIPCSLRIELRSADETIRPCSGNCMCLDIIFRK